jgi:hypothetical protein
MTNGPPAFTRHDHAPISIYRDRLCTFLWLIEAIALLPQYGAALGDLRNYGDTLIKRDRMLGSNLDEAAVCRSSA